MSNCHALDTGQKTELAPYYDGTNNDFLRKLTDVNALCFHGQQLGIWKRFGQQLGLSK